ncbi:hypothetical protein BD410DRAFT_808320 [Rickenella mellea]|uniref:Uncharacterized protein n=1 Tax=Rickenella mellea TaxID=50990 RepID=A0A4Y7PMD2_9AGAM|nr:hypothetical protein BD410DRAFT_808320 [Rickenella mellea]
MSDYLQAIMAGTTFMRSIPSGWIPGETRRDPRVEVPAKLEPTMSPLPTNVIRGYATVAECADNQFITGVEWYAKMAGGTPRRHVRFPETSRILGAHHESGWRAEMRDYRAKNTVDSPPPPIGVPALGLLDSLEQINEFRNHDVGIPHKAAELINIGNKFFEQDTETKVNDVTEIWKSSGKFSDSKMWSQVSREKLLNVDVWASNYAIDAVMDEVSIQKMTILGPFESDLFTAS